MSYSVFGFSSFWFWCRHSTLPEERAPEVGAEGRTSPNPKAAPRLGKIAAASASGTGRNSKPPFDGEFLVVSKLSG
jgi:hypothetical protein